MTTERERLLHAQLDICEAKLKKAERFVPALLERNETLRKRLVTAETLVYEAEVQIGDLVTKQVRARLAQREAEVFKLQAEVARLQRTNNAHHRNASNKAQKYYQCLSVIQEDIRRTLGEF